MCNQTYSRLPLLLVPCKVPQTQSYATYAIPMPFFCPNAREDAAVQSAATKPVREVRVKNADQNPQMRRPDAT